MTNEPANPPLSELFADERVGDLDDSAVDIGGRIRQARVAAGIDAADLGSQLGVRPETVAKWEDGVHSPRGHRLSRLAGLLGVSISWLIVGHGSTRPDLLSAD